MFGLIKTSLKEKGFSNTEKIFYRCMGLLIGKYFPKAEESMGNNGFEYTDTRYFKNGKGCLGIRLSCRYLDRKLNIHLATGSAQFDIRFLDSVRSYSSSEGFLVFYREGGYISLKELEILLVRNYNMVLERVSSKLKYHYALELKNCWREISKSLSADERTLLKGKPVQMMLDFD